MLPYFQTSNFLTFLAFVVIFLPDWALDVLFRKDLSFLMACDLDFLGSHSFLNQSLSLTYETILDLKRRVVFALECVRWPRTGSPNLYLRPLKVRIFICLSIFQAEGQKTSNLGEEYFKRRIPIFRNR